MSWSAFDEFKTFATKIKDQCKRKKDWNKPTSKKQRSSDKSSTEDDDGISRFSSDDEHEEQDGTHRQLHTGKHKIKTLPKRRSPRAYNPCKRMRTDDGIEKLIDDFEGTPEDIQSNNQSKDISNVDGRTVGKSDEAEQLIETLDVMIKDFHSSDEDAQKDKEIVIDTPDPTPNSPTISTSSVPPTVKQLSELSTTGSEWLKKVQSKVSTSKDEECTSTVVKTEVDSAKKNKPKFKRSGLAEQLQKVINREKSDKTFWLHKKITGSDQEAAMDVQVLSIHVQYSLYITRCCLLPSSDDKPAIIDVMFDAETGSQFVPHVGCAVRIYPPWQKLQPSSSPYPVLLCTYYCERLSTPPGSPMVDLQSLPDITTIPWQHSQTSSYKDHSPAKGLKPTKLCFEPKQDSTSQTSMANCDLNIVQTKPSQSISQAIETQGGCSGESVSFQAVIQRIYRRKIKIPRDKGLGSPGHMAVSKSLIMRARNGEDKAELRWTLLVQDVHSNVCEIQIPSEILSKDIWSSCITNGEGKQYSFVDLMVTQRTNRTRSPGLFTLVDSLWCTDSVPHHCQGDNSSQINSSQETASQLSLPPSYCYILMAQDDSHVTQCQEHDYTQSIYKHPVPVSLCHLSSYRDDNKRFTTWCRAICSHTSPSISTSSPFHGCQSWTGQLFVTDASLQHQGAQEAHDDDDKTPNYLKINVKSSHVMTELIHKAILDAGNVLYLQDIVCSGLDGDAVVYADQFTRIKKGATDPCQADLDTGDVESMPLDIYTDLVALRTQEIISCLSSTSVCETLCKVEGVIQGVDEESACCWLECSKCACQDLLERTGLPYYCPECKIDISNPITKTNLDVIIICKSWKEAHVKVKLLQATIEQLLPVSYQESDQGYDIERLLGKSLGPLCCYIEEHGKLMAKLIEIVVSL